MGAELCGKKSTAPCREACPAGIDVPRYVRHVREGNFQEALAVIRERIPFPFVCGYACVHPCESKCARAQFDEPIAIRMLKKAAAENGGRKAPQIVRRPPTGKRVAVIGAGPCGLTAAHYLNIQGHKVGVYEALPLPGGMLRYGIPGYRLPDPVVEREIALIREAGVEIVIGARISSAESLREKGFDAVLVAVGAWRPVRMGIPGEDSDRVVDGIVFLEQVNRGLAPAIGRKVVVVGGGNTSIDASRASVRLGSEVVQLYRRTRAEMPASSEEVAEALEEGVNIEFLTAPVRIEKGRAHCIRMRLGEEDASGRRTPVPVPGSEHVVEFDTLILAIGQAPDAGALHLDGGKTGTVRVDPGSLATEKRGIFAAGDAVTGPSTIIEAIAQGRQACASIDRFLGGTGIIPESLSAEETGELPEPAPQGTMRPEPRSIAMKKRRSTFEPVEQTCRRAEASAEASRCLSCDLRDFDVEVNALICKDCGYCREACGLGIFGQSAEFNPSGYKPAVVEQSDKCIGCLRCLYVCPDFAITIREKP